jgi:uncharacterized protein
MKVVLDTNVIVAALAAQGLCSILFELCLKHEIYASAELYKEIEEALREKAKMPSKVIRDTLNTLKRDLKSVHTVSVPRDACRDSKDLHVLGLAVSAQADVLVTGDQDLLVLKEFQGIPILSPREFYTFLQRSTPH